MPRLSTSRAKCSRSEVRLHCLSHPCCLHFLKNTISFSTGSTYARGYCRFSILYYVSCSQTLLLTYYTHARIPEQFRPIPTDARGSTPYACTTYSPIHQKSMVYHSFEGKRVGFMSIFCIWKFIRYVVYITKQLHYTLVHVCGPISISTLQFLGSVENPAVSCKQIAKETPGAGDGIYYIRSIGKYQIYLHGVPAFIIT